MSSPNDTIAQLQAQVELMCQEITNLKSTVSGSEDDTPKDKQIKQQVPQAYCTPSAAEAVQGPKSKIKVRSGADAGILNKKDDVKRH
jgi:hypothetical protein